MIWIDLKWWRLLHFIPSVLICHKFEFTLQLAEHKKICFVCYKKIREFFQEFHHLSTHMILFYFVRRFVASLHFQLNICAGEWWEEGSWKKSEKNNWNEENECHKNDLIPYNNEYFATDESERDCIRTKKWKWNRLNDVINMYSMLEYSYSWVNHFTSWLNQWRASERRASNKHCDRSWNWNEEKMPRKLKYKLEISHSLKMLCLVHVMLLIKIP